MAAASRASSNGSLFEASTAWAAARLASVGQGVERPASAGRPARRFLAISDVVERELGAGVVPVDMPAHRAALISAMFGQDALLT